MPKVIFAEYNEVIETLDLERLQPAFHEGVHVRRADAGSHHLDILGAEDLIELRLKLAVVVADLGCRHCGCGHFRVIYTRASWGEKLVRRRECRNCGKRVTTWELVVRA